MIVYKKLYHVIDNQSIYFCLILDRNKKRIVWIRLIKINNKIIIINLKSI